jgi:hypothetical protein
VVNFFPWSGFETVTSSMQAGRVSPDLTGSVNCVQLSPLYRETSYRSGLIQTFCNSGSFSVPVHKPFVELMLESLFSLPLPQFQLNCYKFNNRHPLNRKVDVTKIATHDQFSKRKFGLTPLAILRNYTHGFRRRRSVIQSRWCEQTKSGTYRSHVLLRA